MFGKNYYFGLTRKYVTIFGTLFNDINITRAHSTNQSQTVKVPLTYGSLDKLMARVNGDPALDRQVAAVTPAMSFLVSAPKYDASRNLQSTLLRRYETNNGSFNKQFHGVPYNLDFQLYIYADQEEDGLRILENILPYFTPNLTVTAKLVPEMGYNIDIPIMLNDVEFSNESWGEMQDRRKLIWTLNFTMLSTFVGPIDNNRKVIKLVNINMRDMNSTKTLETVRTQPGLTSNGTPTTDIGNTIPYDEIEADDDFGYITQIIPGE